MEIKGSAVKATPDFVREKHPEKFLAWLQALPPASKAILEQPVYSTNWYNLVDSVIVPTQIAGDLFFNGNHKQAAIEIGRFSSDVALKGIYKMFVRVSSPQFVLSRASSIFSAYYNPAEIKVVESKDKKCVLRLLKFQKKEELIMYRIAGWIEHTLEITLKSPLKVEVKTDEIGSMISTNIHVEWN